MPGPGDYNLQSDFSIRRNNGYSIGRQKRLQRNHSQEKLGPGAYPLKTPFEQDAVGGLPFQRADYYRSKGSVQPREKQKMSFPGPGTYSSNFNTTHAQISPSAKATVGRFGEDIKKVHVVLGGRTKRDALALHKDRVNWPGPCSYEGDAVTSLYERMVLKNIKLNGGVYNKSAAFLRTSNSEEHLEKLKEKKKKSVAVPAPGHYKNLHNSIERVSPKARKPFIPTEKRFSHVGMNVTICPTPGPKFDPSNLDLDSTHREFPKASFPKQTRFSPRRDRDKALSPSPSTYKLPTPNPTGGVTAFMMKSPSGKMLDILKESKMRYASDLGPGKYDPQPEKFAVRRVPNVTMSNSKRGLSSFEKAMIPNPGPGQYTSEGFNK